MKKIFNLAVAMSVIAASLVFTSCGDDDDDDNTTTPTENTNNDQKPSDNQKPADDEITIGDAATSFVAKTGDAYIISNADLNINAVGLSVELVSGTQVTLNVSGTEVIIGSANDDKSYAIIADGDKAVAASMSDALADPSKVLFICKKGGVIASGTLADKQEIAKGAKETTFSKID